MPSALRSHLKRTVAMLAASACLGLLVASADASATDRNTDRGTGTTVAKASGYTSHTNVAYASGGSQVLDLYLPDDGRRSRPLVVYVHGGGWGGGDKTELQGIPEWDSLLSQGFAVASVNYTLSPTAVFPQQIHEVKSAIRYLRANGSRYGLSGRVGVWGGSAGAQIASLVGTSCGVRSLEGTIGTTGPSSCVDAVVDLSGPNDFTDLADNPMLAGAVASYLGCPSGIESCSDAVLRQASPLTHLSSGRRPPAFLIGHGDADTLISIEQSQVLYSALKRVCGNVSFFTLHGQDHFFPFSGALSEPYPARTVQTSKYCSPTRTSTEPPLGLTTLGSFFRAHL
ncbi:alpha/beta hydrolase fold domain-containing protein [Streptomyces sp. NPDC088387]|uniref:alpha/beta hydrolase fold domain-containing protein n=1 Tax=Streptomyces sp. NPDC088387 TaxID=3365859 RepID=UPI003824ED4E